MAQRGRSGGEVGGEQGAGAPAIPDVVIRRLPIYQRTLRTLAKSGVDSVSSDELSARVGFSAAQIRRDLSFFGRFGRQGKGYETAPLADAIAGILHVDHSWDVALAGYGNLGRAIVHYRGFQPTFRIAAIFDENRHGSVDRATGLTILPADRIAEEIARLGIVVGIVATPASAAQATADRMIAGGVRALLNYAPVVLRLPPGVAARDIDPVAALQSLAYYLDDAASKRAG
jgi:redox-sensing transcriptional repressor